MESIEIKGFLTIEYAKFEIKKINVLIGAQAQGKSVIAKLVYFFKETCSKIINESILRFETKRDIGKKCLADFQQIFPNYSWKNQEFSISYSYGEYTVSIIHAKKGNRYAIKFDCSNNLMNIQRDFKQRLNSSQNNIPDDQKEAYNIIFFHLWLTQQENANNLKFMTATNVFIPAGRSFFANLQKNIFSFLANNIEIDPFIKVFGLNYENAKRNQLSTDKQLMTKGLTKVNILISEIISGEYLYADEQDWITNKGQRTNLENASSGQQESLPMLLILKKIPSYNDTYQQLMFFIEEPEAHLFPTSQKQIISLIATLHNAFENNFFITTHSPYILTAINNLVVGKDAYEHAQGNPEKLEALEKVLPADELICLEDVSAYTLKNGRLESIIDLENRLIGANLLDAVSDEFDAAFGVATEILYGDD